MKVRALIVDDEAAPRRRLSRLLREAGNVEVVGQCENGAGAVRAIREQEPNLVFLDVQMPGMNGFEVIRSIGVEQMPMVVFVTAYDEFALQAFEAQALDYLLKPFGEERVRKTLERARRFLMGSEQSALRQQLTSLLRVAARDHQAECLLVKNGERVLLLRPNEIDWIEADDDYVHLHVGAESHLLRSTLAELEQRLSPEGFVRIHRSRLVNLDRIKEFRPLFHGESVIILKGGARLTASQNCLRALQERLGATR